MSLFRRIFARGDDDVLRDMRAGFAAMARRALVTGTADEGLSITVYGCSLRGEQWGDWEFTARRLRPASVGRNPEGRDAEERLGAQHEHAVPAQQGDAQPLDISE